MHLCMYIKQKCTTTQNYLLTLLIRISVHVVMEETWHFCGSSVYTKVKERCRYTVHHTIMPQTSVYHSGI